MWKRVVERENMTTELEIVTDGRNIIISPVANKVAESDLLASLEKVNRVHGTTLMRLAK